MLSYSSVLNNQQTDIVIPSAILHPFKSRLKVHLIGFSYPYIVWSMG